MLHLGEGYSSLHTTSLKVWSSFDFQVLGWLHAIEAFQKTGNPLPVNLKFCFEGMEESGSEGLDELLVSIIT